MPTEDELEQRLYDFITDQGKEVKRALEIINGEQNVAKRNKTEQNGTKKGGGTYDHNVSGV